MSRVPTLLCVPCLLALLAPAGCSTGNACSDIRGACLTLEVDGPRGLAFDQLLIGASGAFTSAPMPSSFGKMVELPVEVALIPPPAVMGSVVFTVQAEESTADGGLVVATGPSSSHMLAAADDRSVITVELTAAGDLGVDLAGVVPCDEPGTSSCTDAGGLVTCTPASITQTTSCFIGCSRAGGAHCQQIVPYAPATTAMITSAPNGKPTFQGQITINTDTGQILEAEQSAAIRDPGTGTSPSGIGFQVDDSTTPGSGIFTLTTLTLLDATVTVTGSRGLVIIAKQAINITGASGVDARGSSDAGVCASNATAPGEGLLDPSTDAINAAGAGGGGASGAGGYGGFGSGVGSGTLGGMPRQFDPTLGGAPGGKGGVAGGSGGGVIHLVAGGTMLVGTTTLAWLNVSGCGGQGSGMVPPGGGGAGGTIVLEAVSIQLGARMAIIANGGGGGSVSAGASSDQTNNQPTGGSSGQAARAGNGGWLSAINGTDGGSGGVGINGGGGGGGAGWIVLRTAGGIVSAPAGIVFSPVLSNAVDMAPGWTAQVPTQ